MNHKAYSQNRHCPICWKPITNQARFCRVHARKFRDWLAENYGRPVKIPRRNGRGSAKAQGERRRRQILDMLEFGSLTTKEIATALKMTREGILYQAHLLEGTGDVERERDGHSILWQKKN